MGSMLGPKRPLEQGLNIKPIWDPSMCTKCYFLQYETALWEKPDRTRTGSVASSTEFVREGLVENVEALSCAWLRYATLRCAVLLCFVLFCSMLLRSVPFCAVLCCAALRCAG